MTAINDSPAGKFSNRRNRFTLSISDTSEHDLPDVDGDDTAGGEGFRVGTAEQVHARIVNNQDQDLTARLEATGPTDKGSFSESNTLVDSVTVSSGGGVEALLWTTENDGRYAELRVVVSASTAPSGSNDTIVEYQKDY